MERYERGDVVRLKSGGMSMTVRQGNDQLDGVVGLQWMDLSGDIRQTTLPADMLMRVVVGEEEPVEAE